MKQKAEEIERSTLAKHQVKAERQEQDWMRKVQKIKVDKIADASIEMKTKHKKLQERRMKELTAKNDKKLKADKDLLMYKTDAAKLNENMARQFATEESAAKALRISIKKTATLVGGEGKAAVADRKATTAMLAELRVAEAHADGSIKGLSKDQQGRTEFVLLHAAVETAVGTPTEENVDLAEKQLKDTARKTHEKHGKLVGKMTKDFKNKEGHEMKAKEDRGVEINAKTELKQKVSQEKDGKKVENINDHMELPGKKIKEGYQKKANDLVRSNWYKHEQRVTDELSVKSGMKTERMIANEKSDKKQAAALERENKRICKGLLEKKVRALEKRHKAISAFSAARQGLISSQGTLNGQATAIVEDPSYQSKGNECQTQSKYFVGGRHSTSKSGCEKMCSQKGKACHAFNAWQGNCQLLKHGAIGDHLECPANKVTGERECPNKLNDCQIYQKVTGPGSEEEFAESLDLELGDALSTKDTQQVGYAKKAFNSVTDAVGITSHAKKAAAERAQKASAKERSSKAAALERSAKAAKKAAEERNRKTAMKGEEANRKAAVKRANANAAGAEGASKKAKQAKLLADEKGNKAALKAAERSLANASTKMKERNLKAADADTQARKCEGNLLRRRRTCACDDAKGGRRLLVAAQEDVDEKESTGWERRRYVRRRYIAPSAVDRRRRLSFPSPPPPARIPGAVCPCCPKKKAGVARSRACQLADGKEGAEKAKAKARL